MKSGQTSGSDFERRPHVAFWLLLVGLAIIPFVGALQNEMIGDDVLIVGQRIQVDSARDLVCFLTENYWGDLEQHTRLYRPVTLFLLGAEKLLFGETLWPYRVISLVLHTCCVFLVWELTRLTGLVKSWRLAWFAAAIFAVHPIHAEAVITLYGQADLLATVFGLAALLLYVRFGARPGLFLLLSMCCYGLSLASKESGVLIPCLAVLLRHIRSGASLRPRSWIANLQWADFSWAVTFCAYLGLRILVLGADLTPSGEGSVAMDYPASVRLNLSIVTLAEYLSMLVIPWPQTIYYGHLRDAVFGVPWWQGSVLVLALFGLREWWGIDRRACLLTAGAFFLLLFPVSNVIPIGVVVAERAIYLPSVSFAFLVAWIVQRYFSDLFTEGKKKWASAAFTVLLIVASAMSWNTAFHWRKPVSLWRYTADCHPRSPKAQALAAIHLLNDSAKEDGLSLAAPALAEARQRLEIAQQLNPDARLTVQGLAFLSNIEQSVRDRDAVTESP